MVVLLGRDRARRYPWFTTSIMLLALQLMSEVLLAGRMAMLPYQEIMLSLGDLLAIIALLVVVEIAWQAFAHAPRAHWIANSAWLILAAGCLMAVWGPWPAPKDLALDTLLGKLKLMQLAALKINMLAYLLMIGVGILVVLFGRHYKAGWRSHTQMIAIGLSTAAIAWLAIQGTVQLIARTAHPQSQAEYQHLIGLVNKLVNANQAVYLAALLWWIVWLWLDEPGAKALEPTADTTGENPAS
jgi:hypothetical protein